MVFVFVEYFVVVVVFSSYKHDEDLDDDENNKCWKENGKSQVEAAGGDGVGEKWNEGKKKSLKSEKFYVAQKRRKTRISHKKIMILWIIHFCNSIKIHPPCEWMSE